MKKLLFVLFAVVLAGTASAQRVFDPMDNAVGTNWPDPAVRDVNFYTNGTNSYMNLYNEADHKEGLGSMKIDYRVDAQDGWGGYTVRVTGTTPFSPTMDASAGTQIKFWYKVVNPVVKSSGDGSFIMEFKMGEFDDEGNRDLWLTNTPIDFTDVSGEWIQASINIAETGDRTTGFEYQFGSGDGELQVHKIGSYEIAMVYAGPPTGSGVGPNYPTAIGTVLLDGFAVYGNAYPPIFTFDNSAASGWNPDNMPWAGADAGAITLSDEATDKVEGDGSLKIDYELSAPFGWGGFLSIEKDVTKPEKFEERTAIILFVKNLVPAVGEAGRHFMRVFVDENSGGGNEEWITDIGIDLTQPSGWIGYYLPFDEKPMGASDRFPPIGGFALKGGSGDGIFKPESIYKIRIELFGRGTEDGFAAPVRVTGTILMDVMQQSGFKYADETPPEPVSSLLVVPSSFSNLVTWQDLQGEEGEKYFIFYSKDPITDVTASGVIPLGQNISGGVQVTEHLIRAPKTDVNQTWYYAIYCKDKAENVGPVFSSGAITNTAKGIPTIHVGTVNNFQADGGLAEWITAGVTPFSIKPSDGTAFLGEGDVVDNDDDCSADCYVAIDEQYLYVAYNVTDNIVYDDDAYYPGDTWALDATELFIGLYNSDEYPPTKDYKYGKTPDYHLRFNKQKAREDHWNKETDELLLPGENYYWQEKFPSGYIVEARIPLIDLATKRDAPQEQYLDTIYVKKGWKVGFDFGVFDHDGGTSPEKWRNREARLFWSPFNKDHGYEDARLWMYTWLEDDQVTTDVPTETLPATYSLSQNFPNPFNPATQITYSIEKPGMVSLKIYDILGRVVADLVNRHQETGSYTVNFNASKLSTGVYFYKLESGSFSSVKKMMLVK